MTGTGTKLLITNYLITGFLITKFPIKKFLITNFLIYYVPNVTNVSNPNIAKFICFEGYLSS